MSAQGRWDIKLKSPMGEQAATLDLAVDGTTLTGRLESPLATADLEDGEIDGDKLSWSASVTKPMPIKMEFTATVSGDSISGDATFGAFGSATFEGARAS